MTGRFLKFPIMFEVFNGIILQHILHSSKRMIFAQFRECRRPMSRRVKTDQNKNKQCVKTIKAPEKGKHIFYYRFFFFARC